MKLNLEQISLSRWGRTWQEKQSEKETAIHLTEPELEELCLKSDDDDADDDDDDAGAGAVDCLLFSWMNESPHYDLWWSKMGLHWHVCLVKYSSLHTAAPLSGRTRTQTLWSCSKVAQREELWLPNIKQGLNVTWEISIIICVFFKSRWDCSFLKTFFHLWQPDGIQQRGNLIKAPTSSVFCHM